jgi:uncharacterized membrane protein
MASVEALAPSAPTLDARPPFGGLALTWSIRALVSSAWVSTALFGLYILAFYAAAAVDGDLSRWNEGLPRLYETHTPVATGGIGLHFAAGGLILALGCIQFIAPLRARYPQVHRWIGRVYVLAALCAGIGGLTFILAKGAIGGAVMDVGFGLYGALTVLAAVQAYRYARVRDIAQHRAWAMRLFALAIGSWLYRMDYGFWFMLADGAGHQKDFRGAFDMIMDFFFYIPNLIVVELLLRTQYAGARRAVRLSLAATFLCATVFLAVGTYFFTRHYWGPAILERFQG